MNTISSAGCGGAFPTRIVNKLRNGKFKTYYQVKVLKTYFGIAWYPSNQQFKEIEVQTGLSRRQIQNCFAYTHYMERNKNSKNVSMDFNNALAPFNSGDLQNFVTEDLTHQQPPSAHSTPGSFIRDSVLDETSEEPKTGRSLRLTLEADGLNLVEEFFENIRSVKHNIDMIPNSEIHELCKVDCQNCVAELPSIWILKKHAEDVHAVGLLLEGVQQFSAKLKQALDDLAEQKNASNKIGTNSMTTVSVPGCGGAFPTLTVKNQRKKKTDYQYKVLETYYGITPIPSNQQVEEIEVKTGLSRRQIQNWFAYARYMV